MSDAKAVNDTENVAEGLAGLGVCETLCVLEELAYIGGRREEFPDYGPLCGGEFEGGGRWGNVGIAQGRRNKRDDGFSGEFAEAGGYAVGFFFQDSFCVVGGKRLIADAFTDFSEDFG
jgi:hypothetical protein